ncbi:unnamed protein product [Didymodactylos carnosus]|uniref:Uncharacterized protein n=1 Tax=Didymodactylos carnosus TaxID=1234261 RepID=A0A813RII2_9BILA|nr:unnamed protein product [Didymodactylos carnosus]CAF0949205.1 unnamed protein product [Didymodactylos carnosus]CAF3566401.1 unnamed protein product [Didymodactylos carnosus]CAF3723597.1 unnamed protein product [Didymodactylos carnosus]
MGLKPKNLIRRLFYNKSHYRHRHIVDTVKISTHDQSVQTSFDDTQLTTTVIINTRRSRKRSSCVLSSATPKTRCRSSLKTYISAYSPKIVPLINRSIHRRRRSYDFDLKTPKCLNSEGSNVALVKKIRPITAQCEFYERPLPLVSTETKKIYNETTLVPDNQKLYHNSWGFSSDIHTSVDKHNNNNLSFLNAKEEPEQVDETISIRNQNEQFSVGTIGPLKWSTPIHASFKASSPYSQNPYRQMDLSFSNIFNITCLD